jgi:hypothetical protein
MGIARRLRDYHAAHAAELAADLTRRRYEFACIDALACGMPMPKPQHLCPACFAVQDGHGGYVETVMELDADRRLVCPRCDRDRVATPSPYDLWKQAGGETDAFDKAEYRRLLVEHGHLVPLAPGEMAPPLPCGWPTYRFADDRQWLETAHLTAEERIDALGPKPWRMPSFEEDEDL